ncbi:TPA: site-2 protease family protein [Candidatus Micrarchaeota archaeon]|nr:site-2 protease family protein [Candidatus Micrarchaeota archaeon]
MFGTNTFYIEKDEAVQILISVIAISLALAISQGGFGLFTSFQGLKALTILLALFTLTVGTGFILHEMAHKLVAIQYGAYARFQMWTQGLLLMLALSFLGFVFAAPGAVYIYSQNISRKENGIISVAGPVTNIVLAFVFMALAVFAPVYTSNTNIWFIGFYVNSFLAFFNMLPIFPLDGSKVLAWNAVVWVAVTVVAGYMTFFLR